MKYKMTLTYITSLFDDIISMSYKIHRSVQIQYIKHMKLHVMVKYITKLLHCLTCSI